jgi:hypothetical protein
MNIATSYKGIQSIDIQNAKREIYVKLCKIIAFWQIRIIKHISTREGLYGQLKYNQRF